MGYNWWILILSLFPPVPIGLQIMKPRPTSSKKMGKPSGGRSAKNPSKSKNQPVPSSKKKGADEQGRKQGQKRQVFIVLEGERERGLFFHFLVGIYRE